MGASAPILIIYPIHVLPIRFSEDPKDFVAVYFVLTSSISMPPFLLSEALYRSAAIVPIKKRHDTKNNREDNDGRPTEDFNAGQGFLKFD
jgi:hypothetical protein